MNCRFEFDICERGGPSQFPKGGQGWPEFRFRVIIWFQVKNWAYFETSNMRCIFKVNICERGDPLSSEGGNIGHIMNLLKSIVGWE